MAEVKNTTEAQGCQYWVRHSTLQFLIDGRWSRTLPPGLKAAKVKGKPGLQCRKHVQDGLGYCPFHVLVIEHEAQRFKRAGQASAESRAYKKQQEEILSQSPLRAVNDAFKSSVVASQGAYDDPRRGK